MDGQIFLFVVCFSVVFSFRDSIDSEKLCVTKTKVTNERTGAIVLDRLWEPYGFYRIECHIEGTNLSNGKFEYLQKSCLLNEPCLWNSTVDYAKISWTEGNTKRAGILRAPTANHRMSYRIDFNQKLCFETDYYPSFGYGIASDPSPKYAGKPLKLVCFFDYDFDFDTWKVDLEKNISSIYVNKSFGHFVIETTINSYIQQSELRISNLTQEHNVYNLHVPVHESPYFEDSSDEDIEVEYGRFTYLNCTGYGDPFPTVQWFDDTNQLLHNGSVYYFNKLNSTTLRCEIKNDFNSTSKYFNVTIVSSADRLISDVHKSGQLNVNIVILFVILIAVLLLTVLLITIGRITDKMKIKKLLSNINNHNDISLYSLDPSNKMNYQFPSLSISAELIIPSDQLKFTEHYYGVGNFGKVLKGYLQIDNQNPKIDVAVKIPKNAHSYQQHAALIAELMVMSHVGNHINIIAILGVVIENSSKGQLCGVFEVCQYGSLRSFLKGRRNCFADQLMNEEYESTNTISSIYENITHQSLENVTCSLVPYDDYYPFSEHCIYTANLFQYAYQIASGMKYLSAKNIVHCDLALRNVLLTAEHIVKIADFGLAFDNSLPPVNQKNQQLPLKWLAIESLFSNDFSPQSDVWSFGILMWEIFTLGQKPYKHEPELSVNAFRQFLKSGRRLSKPIHVHDSIWDLMKQCWTSEKNERPNFDECKKLLGSFLHKKFPIAAKSLSYLLQEFQPYINITKSLDERLSCSVDNLLYLMNTDIETNSDYTKD